ncbi:hypothetical protein GWC77_28115, partial [Paraburkholderia sp. NMBU_R16]|uniref:hypothetical protein n=1 Tax=Paraburkholderia sp. NMBU_R16 TaxID=2698676 RepID=UPI001564A495
AFCRNQPYLSLSIQSASRVRCAGLTPALDPLTSPTRNSKEAKYSYLTAAVAPENLLPANTASALQLPTEFKFSVSKLFIFCSRLDIREEINADAPKQLFRLVLDDSGHVSDLFHDSSPELVSDAFERLAVIPLFRDAAKRFSIPPLDAFHYTQVRVSGL